jgi:hypothetical protein
VQIPFIVQRLSSEGGAPWTLSGACAGCGYHSDSGRGRNFLRWQNRFFEKPGLPREKLKSAIQYLGNLVGVGIDIKPKHAKAVAEKYPPDVATPVADLLISLYSAYENDWNRH